MFRFLLRKCGALAPLCVVALALCGCPNTEPQPPAAAFTATPVGGPAPLSVAFTDSSEPGTAPITQRYWNFGDASTSSAISPTHVYHSVGRYSVTLRVVSASGESVLTKERFVEVLQPQSGPQAAFSADPQSGAAPLAVSFFDESSGGDRPITTWRWTFGDGGRSTLQDPVHTYTAAGTYNVELTVANSLGEDTRTETGLIRVAE